MPFNPDIQRRDIPAERDRLTAEAQAILTRSTGDLSGDDLTAYDGLIADLESLRTRDAALANVERFAANPDALERITPASPGTDPASPSGPNRITGHRHDDRREETTPAGHPRIMVSTEHLRAHADAIREGRTFGANESLERAAVTVATDMGGAEAWGSNPIPGPVPLRVFAGIANTPLTGMAASMPSLTLPAGAAGVAEGAQHGEYDAVARADLVALRYGRWTQVTSAVDAFDELVSINGAHAVAIARDLNLADVTAIQTAAGAATAFDAALLDQNVRASVLRVAEAAMVEPSAVVLFGTADALAVVTGFAPANGSDRGSVSTRVYGARVYATAAAAAGVVTAFAPGGFRTFASGMRSTSAIDPKDGSNTFGQWLHSTPAGVGIVGAAASVDVVTP
ncbi:hypothetical protein [Promicromonospora aerolata]|uniref:HK97 family phage major capsid protein n=1 Tax=Promicromonospora aerolata TaxID=195749 RepID=A0ABW4VGU7_9MICO